MRICRFYLIGCLLLALSGGVSAQSEVVRAHMQKQKIPGTALAVIGDGKLIKTSGYGLANVELKVAVTPQTIFQSGSVGKQFTATAVMILVEEGKIALDDSITKYFPEAPPAWKDITIRHLLTHTSGIPDVGGDTEQNAYTKGIVDARRDYTEDELLRIYVALPLEFQPGEKWNYCNTGYQLLGFMIHRVTGMFYGGFLQQRIFKPLGMTSTRVISEQDIIPGRSSGYILVKGELKNQEWLAPSLNTTADGSPYTNVLDMAKWDAALYGEQILKKASLDLMWTPVKLNSGKSFPYGFGWELADANGQVPGLSKSEQGAPSLNAKKDTIEKSLAPFVLAEVSLNSSGEKMLRLPGNTTSSDQHAG